MPDRHWNHPNVFNCMYSLEYYHFISSNVASIMNRVQWCSFGDFRLSKARKLHAAFSNIRTIHVQRTLWLRGMKCIVCIFNDQPYTTVSIFLYLRICFLFTNLSAYLITIDVYSRLNKKHENNVLYWRIREKSTCEHSGTTVLWNTDVSTPPGAIVKVFTESGGRCLL